MPPPWPAIFPCNLYLHPPYSQPDTSPSTYTQSALKSILFFPPRGDPCIPPNSSSLPNFSGSMDCMQFGYHLLNDDYPLISEYIPYLAFWVWVTWLRMIFSGSIHLPVNFIMSFFLTLNNKVMLYCVSASHFLYPFCCWETVILFPGFCYYKLSMQRQGESENVLVH